jgi:prepilin-type N-terminal cleavage/methylation domain-containing protein
VAVCLQVPSTAMWARRSRGGFTLVEVMVVLVILGVLALLAMPRLSRDRQMQGGREFANDLTRELQRTRIEAVSSRLPMYVWLYSDRVELRSAIPPPASTPAAAPGAPTACPCPPGTPPLRVIRTRNKISVVDVVTVPTSTPTANCTTTTRRDVIFGTLGAASLGPPGAPAPLYIYIDNANLPANHPERRYRIDIAALTGFTQLRSSW